jgi:hypothetical protein
MTNVTNNWGKENGFKFMNLRMTQKDYDRIRELVDANRKREGRTKTATITRALLRGLGERITV